MTQRSHLFSQFLATFVVQESGFRPHFHQLWEEFVKRFNIDFFAFALALVFFINIFLYRARFLPILFTSGKQLLNCYMRL